MPPTPAASTRPYAAKGFRPFFLLAGLFATSIVPIWLLILAGAMGPASYVDAITWHAHEMIFGYSVAVIAGFLLTAVGNWTGRETVIGAPLLGLGALWLAGRVVMTMPAALPRVAVAAIDLAFLPALALAIAGPLLAANNRRNFVMIGAIVVMWLANLAIHLQALGVSGGLGQRGLAVAVDVVVLLMIVMAGRVVPMFTKNATGLTTVRGLPALDKAAIAAIVATTVLDAAMVSPRLSGVFAAIAAVLVVARTATWGTGHTLRVPLLWILHAGHAWIAVGLALRAAAAFSAAIPGPVATHALTVGAIGALTLGMMSRVTLGHTGRALAATLPVAASFVLVTIAAVVRVLGPLAGEAAYRPSIFAAGLLWTAAFLIFVVVHARVLTSSRADGKPG